MKKRLKGFTLIEVMVVVLVSAVLVTGFILVQRWLNSRGITKIAEEQIFEGAIQRFEDPMTCVDAYYRAVVKCNHLQYQFCVLKPLAVSNFRAKAEDCSQMMKENGFKPCREPVRGRTDFKDKQGVRSADVFAISPWTRDEVRYTVILQGQSWKIAEEK